jgi:ATP-dependent Lhr-like helicase
MRLSGLLTLFQHRFLIMPLSGPSPFSIPVLTDVRIEQVRGAGVEEILAQASSQLEAEETMAGVRAAAKASSRPKS